MTSHQPALPALASAFRDDIARDLLQQFIARADDCVRLSRLHASMLRDPRVSIDRATNAAAHSAWISAAHLLAAAAGIDLDVVDPAPPPRRPSQRPPSDCLYQIGCRQ